MVDWKYRLVRRVIHFRIWVVLACVLISLFFAFSLRDLTVETHLEDFLPQRHPFMRVQHRLIDAFGGLNQVSLALETGKKDIFNREFLDKVVRLTEDLYYLEGVNISRINSIASRHVKHITADEEGFFVERLLRAAPDTAGQMAQLKERVLVNPDIYGKIVSKDLTSTLIQVDFESGVKTTYIFENLNELQEKYQDQNTRLYLAGRPMLEGWLNFYLPRMFVILGISLLIIALFLYLTFRSKRGVILPLLDSSMATLWGLGAMQLFGLRIDPSTILVPFIILSLGISHSVHTLKRYYEEMKNPKAKSKHAIVSTMSHLLIPGAACVLTDGFGFLSLLMVPLATIRSMALASGLGILANFVTSFMFTPCLLSWMRRPKILEIKREETHKWVDNFLAKLSVFSLNKKAGTIVVVIFLVISAVSVFGLEKIVIGDNTEGTSYLYPDSPYNQSEKFINSQFGGINSYYIFVEAENSVLKVDKLELIDKFQEYLLKEVPEAGTSLSVANAVKALNMFMLDGKEKHYRLPEDDDAVKQYWFLYTLSAFPGDYDHLISRDRRLSNIKFDFRSHRSETIDLTVDKTENFFNRHKHESMEFSYGGGDIGILYAVNDIIRKTIVPNILFIAFLIFLYVSLVYRSPVAGFILLLPLFISNLIVFSLFGFLGTSITTEVLPLASLSGGLGVNYGIYILARLRDEIKEKKTTYRKILHNTLITSGKAVFFSGFIVAVGISVWMFSSIRLQANLGFNLCLALVLNMVTSLLMIPVMVWWIKPVFLFGKVRHRLKRRKTT